MCELAVQLTGPSCKLSGFAALSGLGWLFYRVLVVATCLPRLPIAATLLVEVIEASPATISVVSLLLEAAFVLPVVLLEVAFWYPPWKFC